MDKPQPAYRGDEPYVFVCYAHADTDVVYPEIRWLQDHGVRAWYDEGISAGRVWRAEIGEALEGAATVLFYISRASLKSHHCNREISVALDDEKAILPVYLEDVPLPPDLRIGLARLQAIHRGIDADYRARLAAALGAIASASEALQQAAPASTPMIAVLPFDNLSGDVEQEFFSDGIAEDILNGLAHTSGLVVRARNSSFSFKGQRVDSNTIAARLNVTHLVNGSVRKSGNRVRVSARLTSVADDVDVWSDRYDRELVDVFAVQDEITESILNALNLHFSGPKRQRVDPDAYDALLQARHHLGRLEFNEAIAAFERAIAIEPSYAEALSALGYVYGMLASLTAFSSAGRDRGYEAKQRVLVERALQANPDDPAARTFASGTLELQDRLHELNGLIARHQHVGTLHYVYGSLLRQVGRSDLEIRVFDHNVGLDPLYPDIFRQRGDANLFAGRYQEAAADFASCEHLGGPPMDFFTSQLAFYQRDADRLAHLVARNPSAWTLVPQFRTVMAAAVAHLRGDRQGVETTLAPLQQELGISSLAKFWIALLQRQNHRALEHYRTALRAREFSAYRDIRGAHGLRALFPEYFAQPGYEAMLREFKLDSESIAKLVMPDLPF